MNKSKILGSTLIIAGTTIGAGMLALPLTSAGIGFSTSLIIMLALWAVMTYTALLMVEVHQYASPDATLHSLAKELLGSKGQWVATAAMMFLFYSLCAAYIAGGGSQFAERITTLTTLEVPNAFATVIFTFVVASIVTIGTSTVDRVNRVLFSIKIVAMAFVLFFLAPNVTESYLLSLPVEQGLIIAAIPIIFTSFGFHGSIPAIVKYLDGHTTSLRKVMLFGSAIPLIIYIFWQVVTLGVVSQQSLLADPQLGSLLVQLADTLHSSNISQIIGVFADLALLTSFLGVSLGLFEFLGDSVKGNRDQASRLLTGFLTFIPPMAFALFFPQGFILALGYAAIALVVLALFFPVVLVKHARKTLKTDQNYQVLGGDGALLVTSLVGVSIILIQIALVLGVIPSLG